MSISESTRRDVLDYLSEEDVDWSGRLDEPTFLARLYDLGSLPSGDTRFSDSKGDIHQHRIRNYDWEDDWVFYDDRFDLLSGPDSTLLRFLCEMLHPVVRRNTDEAYELRDHLNEYLAEDGWEIYETKKISGKPVFAARHLVHEVESGLQDIVRATVSLDASYLNQELNRIRKSVDDDPALAIGTSKELVETACKTILNQRGREVPGAAKTLELVKLTLGELELLPENVDDDAKGADEIRKILRTLSTIPHALAELRNLYGSGHGRDAGSKGLQPRHARLAVHSATAIVTFLFDTYMDRFVKVAK